MRLASMLTLGFGLVLACATNLAAQLCPDWEYAQAWVDPVFGDDSTALVNDPNMPYRTINRAIADVNSQQGADGGIVRCLPGLYGNDPCANGEALPILMRQRVHVQGAGAKECVIRGDSTTDNVFAFYPTVPAGTRNYVEVLVDFSRITPSDQDATFDGFTLQGGDVQLYSEGESHGAGVVSNCVFDMRHIEGTANDLLGPDFGVLVVSVYYGEPTAYLDQRLNIINNTFIQGRRRTQGGTVDELARPNNVAICDVNDPAPYWGTAIDGTQPTLRGVAQLNIQNNVFRCLPNAPRTALLGIGPDDTQCVEGTRLGPTNAFDSTLVGGTDVSLTYTSAVTSAFPPTPAVELNLLLGGNDPGFIGEMIEDTYFATNPDVRDWRLLPDSNLVDQGSAPLIMDEFCDAMLRAGNGTFYLDHQEDWPASSFDWDGDGFGNPRINNQPDIGMDETDLFHVAGSYGNDSKSHHLPAVAWPQACVYETGSPRRVMIFPASVFGVVGLYGSFAFWTPLPAWTNMPCTVDPALTLSFGSLYLDLACGLRDFGAIPPAASSWINPVDGEVHNFGQILLDFDETGLFFPQIWFSEQIIAPVMVGGGFELLLSNLQSEYL